MKNYVLYAPGCRDRDSRERKSSPSAVVECHAFQQRSVGRIGQLSGLLTPSVRHYRLGKQRGILLVPKPPGGTGDLQTQIAVAGTLVEGTHLQTRAPVFADGRLVHRGVDRLLQ